MKSKSSTGGERIPIPIILDSDIGSDLDDSWALIQLLRSPELDLKLILVSTGDVEYRAKVTVKLLKAAGREDIPIALGKPEEPFGRFLQSWVDRVDLKSHPGGIFPHGAAKAAEVLRAHPEAKVVAIGPAGNLAEVAQEMGEQLSSHELVGMFGSIRTGYERNSSVHAEYNVKHDPQAFQRILQAPWKRITITPLDSCIYAQLSGENYRRLWESHDPLIKTLMESYSLWVDRVEWRPVEPEDLPVKSSILFDCVAVQMAMDLSLLKMEEIKISVDDQGFTREDPQGTEVNAALGWRDLDEFHGQLVRRLLGEEV